MKVRVSDELNVVRILFHDVPIEESEPMGDNFIMDYDASGNLVGIEVMSAREVFGKEQFERMRSKSTGSAHSATNPTRPYKAMPVRKREQKEDLAAA